MHPKNFPGRKNDRRRKAVKQLMIPTNTKAERLDRVPGFARMDEIRHISEDLIMPVAVARGIRTKVSRVARGKLRV
jgi:hypothetical protein